MRAARVLVIPAVIITMALPVSIARADDRDLKCTMTFQLQTWSIIYKSAIGSGTVHCSNRQSLQVKLRAKGGGLTAGKSEEAGEGEFSPVGHMDELLGAYAEAQVHA